MGNGKGNALISFVVIVSIAFIPFRLRIEYGAVYPRRNAGRQECARRNGIANIRQSNVLNPSNPLYFSIY